ncbi:ImmA/IrrE family metallo-endopeptidase [Lentibacillus populi]|uniref:ImmA/IrrE family metallo-endopeptidase n=1 Tax=Lentibacillus populi TaxID=1827502 RepID=A0A9W5X568_9BACI|nr:ImmA/IrrE family metallo-endopeptidase [Lentibacillus populi]GGB41364.1 ImmA/IrrE family metallo-endopeptidase [Lentibacillus populi]
MWIKNIVDNLVKKYGTNDPFEIASAKNIYVLEHNLHEEIYGFYKYIRRNKFIYINSNLYQEEKRFTCAHELGHSEIHPRVSTPFLKRNTLFSVDKIEVEANRFAVELLMPDDTLYKLSDTKMTINDAASLYGVPDEVLDLKKFKY